MLEVFIMQTWMCLHQLYRFSIVDFKISKVYPVSENNKMRNSLGETKEDKLKQDYEESGYEQQMARTEGRFSSTLEFYQHAEIYRIIEQLSVIFAKNRAGVTVKEHYNFHRQAFF